MPQSRFSLFLWWELVQLPEAIRPNLLTGSLALLLTSVATTGLWLLRSNDQDLFPAAAERQGMRQSSAVTRGDERQPASFSEAGQLLERSVTYARRALGEGVPSHWVWALEFADRALLADPSNTAAHHQRALCLKSLFLFHGARAVLKGRADGPSGRRSAEVTFFSSDPVWEVRLRRFSASFAGSPEARQRALALLERFPQHARLYVEGELFRRWAIAENANDTDSADRTVAELRVWGELFAESHGDHFVADSVGSLLAARTPKERALLAAGHQALGDGLGHYSRSDCSTARQDFERASRHLHQAESPAALLADLHRALCDPTGFASPAFAARLTNLLGQFPADSYPYLKARTLGNLGLHFLVRRQLSQALVTYESAIRQSLEAGEPVYASYLHTNLARLWSQLGQDERAWKHRLQALSRVPQLADSRRVFTVLMAASRAADRMGASHAALDMADELLARLPPEDEHPDLWAETLLRRSQLSARRYQSAGLGDLLQAAAHLGEVADAELVWRIRADLRIAEAELKGAEDPATAIERLTEAIRYFEARKPALELAALYRARALAFWRSDRPEMSRRDLQLALEQIEEQRELLLEDDQRILYFDTARAVFEDAITLEHREGADSQRAFALSEQMRSRLLVDGFSSEIESTPSTDLASLAATVPAGTALLETTLLPDRVLIWLVRRGSWELFEHSVTATEMRVQVTELLTKISLAAPAAETRELSEGLYRSLLAEPLARLRGETRLIVVADDVLSRLPWTALHNPWTSRYLVQDFAVVSAPSATVYLHGLLRRETRRTLPAEEWQALIVGDPRFDPTLFPDLAPLPGAVGEAREIAQIYRARPLLRGEATKERFVTALPRVDLIHFAGHSLPNVQGLEPGLLLASSDRDGARTEPSLLSTLEIAQFRLSRPRLVVLAGCATASGPMTRSEGPLSLARAFLASGVPTVVATLWPIEDGSAAQVFPQFHRRLQEGEDAADALRSTLLQINDRGGPSSWDDLKSWAGFQALGS